MQERSLRLSSGDLTYFQAGSGRPLIYLHPAGGVRRSQVLEGLARSFALHVPVIPGFEGTPFHSAIKTRKGLGNLVAEFIDRVIGSRCDVMGWSFGGCVALRLALERPERVDHLVLECPAGLHSIDRAIKRVNRAVLEHYGAQDGKDEGLAERIADLEHTTLIVQGTQDRVIPEQSAQLLKSRLRHAFLVYIWEAGHDIEVDQPERVLGVVKEFLEHSEAFMVNRGSTA
jgi:pimeloyl-ACP methyl ester carboxylesterase